MPFALSPSDASKSYSNVNAVRDPGGVQYTAHTPYLYTMFKKLREHTNITVYTTLIKLQGCQSFQFGTINHCESISSALVQIKLTTGALERQQQLSQKGNVSWSVGTGSVRVDSVATPSGWVDSIAPVFHLITNYWRTISPSADGCSTPVR